MRSRDHIENDIIIPEGVFEDSIENNPERIYNPRPLREMARENIKIDDKQLSKELAKKMINPYHFTDRALQVGFNITLDSDHITHANSKLTIKPNFRK